MRPRILAGLALLGLVAWVGANAFLGPPRPAGAQTAIVEIRRAQKAGYLPRPSRDRLIVILAIGSDARPGERVDRLRADSIHLIAVNPRKRAGTVLGFPRDSYVDIPGRGTSRINDALVYGGPPLLVRTVESITGIRIDYWALTSFKGFSRIVDGINGLSVRVRYPMHDRASGTSFNPGRRTLKGGQALAFARDRHSPSNGDFGRSENQGRLILAALGKFTNRFAEDPTTLFRWIRVGLRGVKTDLSLGELIDLGLLAAQIEPKKVRNVVAPGSVAMVGSASVVRLTGSAQSLFRDIRDDGILNR
jgi:polyisoprenyl-teichoic acid--peptidoglycan teichoic acid transferase